MALANIIDTLRRESCMKKKCMNSWEDTEIDILCTTYDLSLISIKSYIVYFDYLKNKKMDSIHFSCVVEILHLLYKKTVESIVLTTLEFENKDLYVEDLITLGRQCLYLPDLICPALVDVECENSKKYESILQTNIAITLSCFHFYLDILFTQFGENGTVSIKTDESRTITLEHLSFYQRLFIKKTAPKAFSSACSRLGDQPWTNSQLKKISDDIVQSIKICSKHKSFSSLLTGIVSDELPEVLFRNGLFGSILNELIPLYHKDNWKKNIPIMHAVLWCLKKITYPNLGPHVVKLVPLLLLLTDDYNTDHKLLGILSLTHLIENVIPTDLKLFNHADVIYDALMKQLYSNQGNVYEVTLACLLKLLPVLQSKPSFINGDKFTCWDNTFVKLMNNVDLASKMNVELVLLKYFPKFIELLGSNTIKHIDRIIDLINLPIQGDGEDVKKKRILTSKILYGTIQSCWPVIHLYQKKIFKIVLRMLVDLCMANSIGRNLQKEVVEEEISNVLVLLKTCCPLAAEETFSSIITLSLDPHFDSVTKIIKNVLEIKECRAL